MVGQKVKDAQWLLAGHNRYDGLATYKDGAVDGDYGPLTAQATYKAKYWLGYPDKSLDRSFGQTLYEYLIKDGKKLPADYLRAAKTRLAAVASNPGQKALEQAVTQIGTKESPPGSNRQKYGLVVRHERRALVRHLLQLVLRPSRATRLPVQLRPVRPQRRERSRNRLCVVRTPRAGRRRLLHVRQPEDAHIGFFEKWIKTAARSDGRRQHRPGQTSQRRRGHARHPLRLPGLRVRACLMTKRRRDG